MEFGWWPADFGMNNGLNKELLLRNQFIIQLDWFIASSIIILWPLHCSLCSATHTGWILMIYFFLIHYQKGFEKILKHVTCIFFLLFVFFTIFRIFNHLLEMIESKSSFLHRLHLLARHGGRGHRWVPDHVLVGPLQSAGPAALGPGAGTPPQQGPGQRLERSCTWQEPMDSGEYSDVVQWNTNS